MKKNVALFFGKHNKPIVSLLLILLFTFSFSIVQAATRTASVSGNWSSTATWGGSAVPTAADDVTINSGITVTVDVAAACNTVTFAAVAASSNLTLSGTNTLTVTGLVTMPRPSSSQICSINVNAGTFSCGSLTMAATSVSSNARIDRMVITTGTATISGTITTSSNAGACQINFTGAGTLNLGGTTGSPTLTTFAGCNVNYTGAAAQNIIAHSYLGNVGISGGGAKTVTGATTITGNLSLTNGIVTTTATNIITLSNTSQTAIIGGSATSYISGPLKWTLPASLATSATYTFPVGKGGAYYPFALVNPTTGTGTVTASAEAFNANAAGTLDATLSALSTTEYWALTTVGNFTNSSITVTRPSAITPYAVIGGSATAAGTYTNLGGTGSTYGVSGSSNIATNRYFVLGTAGCTPPANPGNPTSNSPQCPTPGVTLSAPSAPPSGETWYWQTTANGTSTANSGSTYNVTSSGTYYLRSQFNSTLCWSLGAGSLAVVVTGAPTVNTPTSASITMNSVTLGGTIADIGCPSDNISERGIYYSTTAGFTPPAQGTKVSEIVGSYTAGAFTEAVSGLTASTPYYYKAFATNSYGTAYSAQATFTTSNPPCVAPTAAPTNLTFSTIAATTTNGSFTAASPAPSGYLVIRSTSSSLSANPVDGQTYSAGNTVGGGTVIQASASTSFTQTGLTANTQYYYFIFSYNNTTCAGGPMYFTSTVLQNTATTCLTAPVASAGSSIGAGSFTANWASVTGATGYQLDVSTSATFATFVTGYNNLAISGGATTSQLVSGLSSLTTYYYRVRATGAGCTSASSSNITVATLFGLPIYQGFNQATIPTGWNDAMVSGTSYPFSYLTAGVYPVHSPQEGTNFVRYNSFSASSGCSQRLYTSAFSTMGVPSVDVSYWWYTDPGYATYLSEGVTVQYSFDGTTWTNAGVLSQRYDATAQWVFKSVTIPQVANHATVYIGFLFYSQYGNDCSLDNVIIKQTPTCPVPTGLTTLALGSTTAKIGWNANPTTPSGGYSWELRSSGAAGSGATGLVASGVTSNLYANITGLSASTAYSAYVRADCGGGDLSDWTSAYPFTTSCTELSVPWTENFDGMGTIGTGVMPSTCWTTIYPGGSTQPWATMNAASITYNDPNSAPNYLTCYYYSYPAGNKYVVTPGFTLTGGQSYDFSFNWAGDGTLSYDTAEVRYNTMPSGTGSTLIGVPFLLPGVTTSTSYSNVTSTLTPATTGTYYFLIRVAATSNPLYIGFDDFSLTVSPTCVKPTVVHATALASTSATLAWTASPSNPGNGYIWEVRTSGAAGSGATGLAAFGTANGASTGVTGLTATTTYTAYVRADCGNGDLSFWSSGYTFTTPCTEISTWPYTENFDGMGTIGSGVFPSCWKAEYPTGSTQPWATMNAASITYNDPFSSPNYLTCYYYSSPAGDKYMITPGFSLVGGQSYDLGFKFAGDSYASYWTADLRYNTLQTGVGSTQIGAAFLTSNLAATSTSYASVDRNFTPATSGTYYFMIHVNATSTPYYVGFDDFYVYPTPTCIVPTAVTTTALGATTATISWTGSVSNPSQGYEWEVRTTGAAGSGATGLTASGTTLAGITSANVTGLAPTTTYKVYVRGHCDANDYSFWTQYYTFTTACLPISIYPWSENFDLMGTTGQGILPSSCWTAIPAVSSPWVTGGSALSSVNDPYSMSNYVCSNTAITGNKYLVLPGFSVTAGYSYNISFQFAGDGNSLCDVDLRVNTSPVGTGSTQIGGKLDSIGYPATTTYHAINRSFYPTQSGVYYFMIHVKNNTAGSYYMGFDDFSVNELPGLPPMLTSLGATSQCTGSDLLINGLNLGSATSVTIGGTPATIVGTTDNSVTVLIGTQNGTVVVTTPIGTTDPSAEVFNYKPVPTASTASGSTVCQNLTLNLTGNTDFGSSFSWTGPNGFTSTSQNPSISNVQINGSGVYTFTSTYNGCTSAPARDTVIVYPAPSAVSISPNSANVCLGSSQMLTASGGSASGVIFSEDFETYPTPKFAYSGDALVTVASNTSYYSQGSKSVLLTYNNSIALANNDAYTSQVNVNLVGSSSAQLTFSHIAAFEGTSAGYDFDNGWVQYSTDGGTTWTTFPVSAYAGAGTLMSNATYTSGQTGTIFSTLSYPDWITAAMSTSFGTAPATSLWKNEIINIPPSALTSNQFRIRFLITSDGSVLYAGWLIDNIKITTIGSANLSWSPTSNLYTDVNTTTPYTTGNINPVYAKPISTTTYTYTATSDHGCISSGTSTLTVPIVPAPTGNAAQTFCNTATVASLTATGTAIKWYAAASGGTALTAGTALVNGTEYWASQTLAGCESQTRFGVTATLTTPAAPTATTPQTFCLVGTVSELTATGSNIQWYAAASGGSALTAGSALANGSTYYASQTVSGCESSSRYAVTVQLTSPAAPTGNAVESFNFSGTVSQLTATGANIQWYAAASGGSPLAGSTALVNNTTYYASQTVGGCESSNRHAVLVHIVFIKTVKVHMILDGLYDATSGLMNACIDGNTGFPQYGPDITDRIQVDLMPANGPYSPTDAIVSISGVDLATNGLAKFEIAPTNNGNYYIRITNRNHLETWSALPISFAADTVEYDFRTSALQAYGSNPQAQVSINPNYYGFYLGDLNQSGYVDLDDFIIFEPDNTIGSTGFLITDINGGGYVDLDDFVLLEPWLTIGPAAEYPAKK